MQINAAKDLIKAKAVEEARLKVEIVRKKARRIEEIRNITKKDDEALEEVYNALSKAGLPRYRPRNPGWKSTNTNWSIYLADRDFADLLYAKANAASANRSYLESNYRAQEAEIAAIAAEKKAKNTKWYRTPALKAATLRDKAEAEKLRTEQYRQRAEQGRIALAEKQPELDKVLAARQAEGADLLALRYARARADRTYSDDYYNYYNAQFEADDTNAKPGSKAAKEADAARKKAEASWLEYDKIRDQLDKALAAQQEAKK
jgi:hypothetical protein